MARWLALLSHHKKVPSLTPGMDRPFCVEFACSLCQCWAYAAYSGFLPQPKDMQVRHAKLDPPPPPTSMHKRHVYGLTGSHRAVI